MGGSAIYVGPYPMWTDDVSREELEKVVGEGLDLRWSQEGEAVIEPGEGRVPVLFAAPRQTEQRRGGPECALTFSSYHYGCVGLDLREVDRNAEVNAFRRAYKAELDAITQRVGSPPVIRWGVLYVNA
jgi:hypothetical protein